MASKNDEYGSFYRSLKEDLRENDLRRTFRKNWKNIHEFYLSDEKINSLSGMNPLKRWILSLWWLLKSMYFKLSVNRRILLLVGIILTFSGRQSGNNLPIIGGIILVFIILLELKDKLSAKSELDEGHSVQASLMPAESPKIPGWDIWLYSRPANEVSGDLIDFQEIGTDKYGIALGDVAGKGLKAALLMAKLQATLRALSVDSPSLSKLGNKINQIFHRDSLPNLFASMIYLILESNKGSIRLLNAGHIPPVIIKGEELSEMSKGGPAFGIIGTADYKESSFDLESGNILVIYSDGVTESINPEKEFYGKTRFFTLLSSIGQKSSREIGLKILEENRIFIKDEYPSDDLSLVIIRKT